MSNNTDLKKWIFKDITQVLLCVSPFFTGIFHDFESGILALVILIWIAVLAFKKGALRIPKTSLMLAMTVLVLIFPVSCLWAVDKGMTVIGFLKFLPLPLFLILRSQGVSGKNEKKPKKADLKTEERTSFLLVPYAGAVMTILSAAVGYTTSWGSRFLVQGRLGGFFEYPNTFACFLLVGMALLLLKQKHSATDLVLGLILACGIVLSGSRAVFVLFAALLVFYVFYQKNTRVRWITLGSGVLVVSAFVVVSIALGKQNTLARFTTMSFRSSTLLGRLLYYKDALPEILRNPLGLGYYGYHYKVQSFQTGVYDVVHVHNDLLQLLLDVGWVPAGVAVFAVVRRWIKLSVRLKVASGILVLHMLFDFDLQFVAMGLLLLAMLTEEEETDPAWVFTGKSAWVAAVSGSLVLGAVTCILGCASFFSFCGKADLALQFYPWLTSAKIEKLTAEENLVRKAELADAVLDLNQQIPAALDTKAQAALVEGDVATMMEYKKKAIWANPYRLWGYEDYIDMLWYAATTYEAAGDAGSAQACKDEMLKIPAWLERVKANTSSVAWEIYDKPELELPSEYQLLLDSLRTAVEASSF